MKQIFIYCSIMLALAGSLFFIYYRIGRFNNIYGELHNRMELLQSSKNIERLDSSKWYTNKWEMYHTLSFEPGNTMAIDNHIDTIFHCEYTLKADTLWLLMDEKHPVPNKIKLHNKEELVFESFLDKKTELRYSRINKIQK